MNVYEAWVSNDKGNRVSLGLFEDADDAFKALPPRTTADGDFGVREISVYPKTSKTAPQSKGA